MNCLDGIFFKEELITIITTNHIELLDPALIRPGRVDMQVEIKQPIQASVEQYISKFYNKEISLLTYHTSRSMAEVVDICLTNEINECIELLSNKT